MMETKRLLAHLWRGLEEKIGDGELEEPSHPHGEHHIRNAQLRAFARRHSIGYHRRRIFAQCRHQHQRQIAHIACASRTSNTTLREGPVDRSASSKKLIKRKHGRYDRYESPLKMGLHTCCYGADDMWLQMPGGLEHARKDPSNAHANNYAAAHRMA